MRISDWSSDVCSSDLEIAAPRPRARQRAVGQGGFVGQRRGLARREFGDQPRRRLAPRFLVAVDHHVIADAIRKRRRLERRERGEDHRYARFHIGGAGAVEHRSEEHTSELQSLMRISYAVFCLTKKKQTTTKTHKYNTD